MSRNQYVSIGILAAASLLLESTLTRLLAVSQYYHFAFLVISLALVGYGASGSILFLLSVKFKFTKEKLNRFLLWMGISFFLSVILAYLIINYLPFDSYSIAWDRKQIPLFFLYYLALTIPFIISGLTTGACLSTIVGNKHLVYAANLLGSGTGVCVAPVVMYLAGVPGGVLLSALLGILVAFLFSLSGKTVIRIRMFLAFILLSGIILLSRITWRNLQGKSGLGMEISPYKGLAQALRVPGVERIFGQWNAISRIDLLENAGTHRLPGLSYVYSGPIPNQLGLSIDADTLHPITLVDSNDFPAAEFLPEAIIFGQFHNENVLVIEPGGGLGALQAISGGAQKVTVLLNNPLQAEAIDQSLDHGNIYQSPRVHIEYQAARNFLKSFKGKFDIVYYPLVDAYRPVASGAFSLSENYHFTIESFKSVKRVLEPDGILVISRWLQTPPSESVRIFATLLEAVDEDITGNPEDIFIAFRSIQTMTILMKPSGWGEDEIHIIREFISNRNYDLVWSPGITYRDVNQNNKLQEPKYYLIFKDLLRAPNRETIYRTYPFEISPPTDNHPFFYHFFKWGQTGDIIATLGHTWQPFGGSGFLVLFALLALVIFTSAVLILLPLLLSRETLRKSTIQTNLRQYLISLIYFTFLGFAFLFVEIPLIQKAILLFGHPIFAFTSVVFVVLFFSGLGSASARSSFLLPKLVLIILPIFAILTPLFFNYLIQSSLGWSSTLHVFVVVLSIAPLSYLMGFPFSYGLIALEGYGEKMISWVWAVNGSVSVAASVIAAILTLSFGFNFVLLLGAVMYAGGSVIYLFGLNKSGAI